MAKKFMLLCLLLTIAACVSSAPVSTANTTAEIQDALDKADKAAEVLKNGLDIAGDVADVIEAFTDEIPFVSVIGSLFSIISEAIETAEIEHKLDEISDEMKQQFADINRRLDMMEWTETDLLHSIAGQLEAMKLQDQFDAIEDVQEAKVNYQNLTDSTTLQKLREECIRSDPTDVINDLHTMIVSTDVTSTFNDTIFQLVEYGIKDWAKWTQDVGNHFLQAMLMEQVCFGVKINDDKTRPTEADLEYYASISSAKFLDVMKTMNYTAQVIDQQWHEMQLPNDINRVMTENSGGSVQDVADALYDFLKNKYGFFFGVTVHQNPKQVTATYINNNNQKVTVTTPPGSTRTAVVNWSSRANLGNATAAKLAYDAVNGIQWTGLDHLVDGNEFMNDLSAYQNSVDLIYYITENCDQIPQCSPDGEIAGRYDPDNTYMSKNEHCHWSKTTSRVVCSGMLFPVCRKKPITEGEDYAFYAVIGF